jgi:hypothetical protein
LKPVDVFIHSSPHSGSTWLGYVLGSGRQTAFVGELYRAWDAQDRVPCTVCASRGLDECVVLAGIEALAPQHAFDFIAARNGKDVIVENSKRVDWTRQFIGRAGRDARIIHLVKDPRSRWASLRRREAADMNTCMMDWCRENQEIIDFTQATGMPTMVAAYDLVAAQPETEIAALFGFFGATFDTSVLRYWEVEHHGFAANGASSAIIRHQQFVSPPKHFSTADDRFYEARFGQSFVDERWRTELPDAENEAILQNEQVRGILNCLGYGLTQTGMFRTSRAAGRESPFRSFLRRWILPGPVG